MLKIKPDYNNTVIAFGSNGAVLSKRTPAEILDLAIIAQDSKNPNLVKLFVDLPSLEDLRRMKMQEVIKKYKKATKKVETRK